MHSTEKQFLNNSNSPKTLVELQKAYEELKIAYEELKKNIVTAETEHPGDITENKKIEQQLFSNENRYRALVENSADALAILTETGKPIYLSASIKNVLGYTPEEAMQLNLFSLTHPDDIDGVAKVWEQVLMNPGVPMAGHTSRMLHKDGTWHWLEDTVTNMLHDPDINGIVENFRDITEKINSENEIQKNQLLLKQAEANYRAIFNQANDVILLANDAGKYVQVNPAAERMLGYSSEEMLQLSGHDIIEKMQPGKLVAEEWNGFITEGNQSGIVELKRKDGKLVICHYNAAANILPGLHLSILTDITQRENSRREIESQRKQINSILNSITDGFFSVDNNWIVTYWNIKAEHLLLQKREHMIGKNLWEIFADAKALRSYSEYHRAMEQNISVLFEDYFPPLDKWFEISAYPSEEGLSVYFKDITERKKTEDAIRASNERYDMVAKATNDSIWDWDISTGMVTRPGNLLENLFGYEGMPPTDVDNFWSRHVHPADWEAMNRKRNALFEDPLQNYWEDEYRFLKPDGEYAYIYDRGYIIRDEERKAIRMIGASQDITKEKEHVNEMLRIQQNLDSLINTTTDPIWSINIDFKIIAANKAYSDFIETINGQPVKEGDEVVLITPGAETMYHWGDLYARALNGESFSIERSFTNPYSKDMWHTIVSFSPIINKEGDISGVACYQKDVTALKKAGKKLEELNNSLAKRAEELAASNTELERFAYVASHDLQEPLRMISSFLQLLHKKYKDKIDDTAASYIHFSVDGAERMKRLINDLLQYSRVGTASLEVVPVDMNEVVNDVLQIFQHEIQTIKAEIIVEKMPVIEAGRSAMTQLVQNLVGNALKYRRDGETIISISVKETIKEWVFTITDNGIGLDSKFRDKIFILFQRLHNKDEYSGTGIGLAVCKKITDRYHGRIWVESELGKGSTFIFTIPKKHSIN